MMGRKSIKPARQVPNKHLTWLWMRFFSFLPSCLMLMRRLKENDQYTEPAACYDPKALCLEFAGSVCAEIGRMPRTPSLSSAHSPLPSFLHGTWLALLQCDSSFLPSSALSISHFSSPVSDQKNEFRTKHTKAKSLPELGRRKEGEKKVSCIGTRKE